MGVREREREREVVRERERWIERDVLRGRVRERGGICNDVRGEAMC